MTVKHTDVFDGAMVQTADQSAVITYAKEHCVAVANKAALCFHLKSRHFEPCQICTACTGARTNVSALRIESCSSGAKRLSPSPGTQKLQPHESQLSQRRNRRASACGATHGGLQHPLAAAHDCQKAGDFLAGAFFAPAQSRSLASGFERSEAQTARLNPNAAGFTDGAGLK